jgi:cell division protease FtsH
VLLSREVIFTEDVERIFGKRPWTSRTDEILAARANAEQAEKAEKEAKNGDNNADSNGNDDQSQAPTTTTTSTDDVIDVEYKE